MRFQTRILFKDGVVMKGHYETFYSAALGIDKYIELTKAYKDMSPVVSVLITDTQQAPKDANEIVFKDISNKAPNGWDKV